MAGEISFSNEDIKLMQDKYKKILSSLETFQTELFSYGKALNKCDRNNKDAYVTMNNATRTLIEQAEYAQEQYNKYAEKIFELEPDLPPDLPQSWSYTYLHGKPSFDELLKDGVNRKNETVEYYYNKQKLQVSYDSKGQIISLIQYVIAEEYQHCVVGRDSDGNIILYSEDGIKKISEVPYEKHISKTWTYEYDEQGRIKTKIWNEENIFYHMEYEGDKSYTYLRKLDPQTKEEIPISILDNSLNKSNMYGFSQSSMEQDYDNMYNYTKMKERYPNITYEDYKNYLKAITNTGCGYTAWADCIFEMYKGKEKEFKKTYGYDMYTIDKEGMISYNSANMIFDLYYTINGDTPIVRSIFNEKDSLDDLNIIEKMFAAPTAYSEGLTQIRLKTHLNTQYNENIEMVEFRPYVFGVKDKEEFTKKYNQYLSEGKQITVASENYDMINYETGEVCSVDAHAMYLTGIEGNYIIVSSWGEKYKVSLDEKLYFEVYSRKGE